MALRVLFPQNVMVADTSGNIYYQRTGRVPKRPAGVDPSLPLDGTTKATEWQGLHESSDHLQVLNPPQGFMQNCNIPPDAMMPGSPFRLGRHAAVSVRQPRLRTAPRRLDQPARGARDRAARRRRLGHRRGGDGLPQRHPPDRRRSLDRGAARGRRSASGAAYALRPFYSEALEALFAWDGALEAKSSGALVYAYFREQLTADLGAEKSRAFASERRRPLLGRRAARAASARARRRDRCRAARRARPRGGNDAVAITARSPRSTAIASASAAASARGRSKAAARPARRRCATWATPRRTRTTRGGAGTARPRRRSWCMSKPPRSWLYIPLGQSDRPESPHFADQAEKAFSPRQLKPSWWLPEDLAGHVESRTVLEPAHAGQ